jgi:hypothetical protein
LDDLVGQALEGCWLLVDDTVGRVDHDEGLLLD